MGRERVNCDVHRDRCPGIKDPSDFGTKKDFCNCVKNASASSKVLENILDIASTLVSIMLTCGIHECKAQRALDVIIYAFMHFDEVAEHPGAKCKKRIRKEEFYNDLTQDCGMTKSDTKLTYSIVKCAFKAFYHKRDFNDDITFVNDCDWRSAANKTISAYAESELTGRRILCAYENYICRLQARSSKTQDNMNTCACGTGIQSIPQLRPRGHVSDPSKPQRPSPSEHLLCAQLKCQFICPPGAICPQIVCKDPCGRLFLKVDGDMICFDPLIMECEARRAAMEICPPSNADRIKALRESLKPCLPRDIDSDEKRLAKISKMEEREKDETRKIEKREEPKGNKRDDKKHLRMEKPDVKEEPKTDDNDAVDDDVAADDDDAAGADDAAGNDDAAGDDDAAENDDKLFGGAVSEKTIDGDALKDDDRKQKKRKHEENEKEEEQVDTTLFISAEFSILKTGKRKLNVRVKGACRKNEKYINFLNRLHIEGNQDEEKWYNLTPTVSAKASKSSQKQPSQKEDIKSNAYEDTANENVVETAYQDAGESANETANEPADDAEELVNEEGGDGE